VLTNHIQKIVKKLRVVDEKSNNVLILKAAKAANKTVRICPSNIKIKTGSTHTSNDSPLSRTPDQYSPNNSSLLNNPSSYWESSVFIKDQKVEGPGSNHKSIGRGEGTRACRNGEIMEIMEIKHAKTMKKRSRVFNFTAISHKRLNHNSLINPWFRTRAISFSFSKIAFKVSVDS